MRVFERRLQEMNHTVIHGSEGLHTSLKTEDVPGLGFDPFFGCCSIVGTSRLTLSQHVFLKVFTVLPRL